MRRFMRVLFGRSHREARADQSMEQQGHEHRVAMREADAMIKTSREAAREGKRAAVALMEKLKEDFPK